MSERYEIKAKLGQGGAGTVYRAWDTHLRRTVAIKRLLDTDGSESGEKMRKELLREASLLSSIQHPNICQVYDFGVDEEGGFVVMEFVNGENLEEAANRRFSIRDFCTLAEQVLEGVSAAHSRNILHRDLKPSNVVINWLPNARFQVKILDFGLAKFSLQPVQQTIDQETHTAKGSIHFMAPEQFEHRPLDARADIYSLGCLFYLVMSGQHPFGGRTMVEVMTNHLGHRINAPIEKLRPEIPPKLAQWIGWMMNRRPEDRPGSAVEALDVLRHIVENLPDERVSQPAAPVVTEPPAKPERPRAAAPIPPAPAQAQPKTVPVFVAEANVKSASAAPADKVAAPASIARAPTHSTRRVPVATARVPVKRSHWSLPAVICSAAILILTTALVWRTCSQSRQGRALPGTGSTAAPATTVASADPAATPPQDGLLLWLDAAYRPFTERGTTGSMPGGPVDHWTDRAVALGGNNAALNHTVTSRTEGREEIPTLRRVSDGGLREPHAVVTFDGVRSRLVSGRGKGDQTGDPIGSLLRGTQLTCLAVARVSKLPPVAVRIVSAKMGAEVDAWGIGYGGGEATWHSGIRRRGGEAHNLTIADPPGQFRILTCVWNKNANEYRFHIVKPDGTILGQDSVFRDCEAPGPISEVRLGATSKADAGFFPGDVAEILLYNKALGANDLEAAEAFLLRKYFR